MSDRFNKVRMEDIAKALNISTVTVSKALADKESVGAALKAQIKETALKMGYIKNNRQSLGHKGTVTVLIPERLSKTEHSFYSALYIYVSQALQDEGFLSILEIVTQINENNLSLSYSITDNQVSGILVLGVLNKNYLKALQSTHIPLILLDFYDDDIQSTAIIPDNFLGAYDMTRYIISKGHKKIGFVGSINTNTNALDRFYGYSKAMRTYDLNFLDEWIIDDRINNVFCDEFVLPSNMPTAFFCNCDQSAYHFMRYLIKQGYKIPDDISIVGFYDHIFAVLTDPHLTTYHISMHQMATKAVSALINIQNKTSVNRVFITGHLVERNSVKNII